MSTLEAEIARLKRELAARTLEALDAQQVALAQIAKNAELIDKYNSIAADAWDECAATVQPARKVVPFGEMTAVCAPNPYRVEEA